MHRKETEGVLPNSVYVNNINLIQNTGKDTHTNTCTYIHIPNYNMPSQ